MLSEEAPNLETNPLENETLPELPLMIPTGKYGRVHVFYYQWYANPEYDPKLGWNHWNHRILPYW
jgi:hypothetical protein